MIERQKRLNDPGNPEKAKQSGNEKEHFPFSDLSARKMGLGEYNTDYQEDGEFHQLEDLKTRNVVDEFYFFQSRPDILQIIPGQIFCTIEQAFLVNFFLKCSNIVIEHYSEKLKSKFCG